MPRRGRQPDRAAGGDTRDRLLAAASACLEEHGFLGASARVIAERADVAVGSIHYHFDSVDDLLLQAFDRRIADRLQDYERIASDSPQIGDLGRNVADAFAQDRDAGHFRLLAELVGAASTSPAMAVAVADRTEPWVQLAERTVAERLGAEPLGGLVTARQAALALVALFIGLEQLDHLDDERFDVTAVVDSMSRLATLADAVLGADQPRP